MKSPESLKKINTKQKKVDAGKKLGSLFNDVINLTKSKDISKLNNFVGKNSDKMISELKNLAKK